MSYLPLLLIVNIIICLHLEEEIAPSFSSVAYDEFDTENQKEFCEILKRYKEKIQ
jgi:hypothetical protein